jgi:aryl-alcohol dehydrogenase-like predicted oxidoreductase
MIEGVNNSLKRM